MFTEKHNILEISNVIYYFSDLKTQQQHEINKYLISHEI